jgi:hypothetical protein
LGADAATVLPERKGSQKMITTPHNAKRKGASVVAINGMRGKIVDICVIGKDEWFDVKSETGGYRQFFVASELTVIR